MTTFSKYSSVSPLGPSDLGGCLQHPYCPLWSLWIFFLANQVVTVRKGEVSQLQEQVSASVKAASMTQIHRPWRFNHQFPGGLDEKNKNQERRL